MRRLVLKRTTTNEVESWDHVIPFEYSNKEDFQRYLLNMLDTQKAPYKLFYWEHLSEEEVLQIIDAVMTIDEWFELDKKEI